jgi:hypothetical protein
MQTDLELSIYMSAWLGEFLSPAEDDAFPCALPAHEAK